MWLAGLDTGLRSALSITLVPLPVPLTQNSSKIVRYPQEWWANLRTYARQLFVDHNQEFVPRVRARLNCAVYVGL